MTRIILFIFLIVPITHLNAQNWPKFYNSMTAFPYGAMQFYDKGFIIVGVRADYKYGWIIKTDVNGNTLWNKKLGNGKYNIYPHSIEQSYDGGLIIGGSSEKIGNQSDAFILKLNSCGEIEWCKTIFTPTIPYDLGVCAKPTVDGGYVLLGLYNDLNQKNRINLFKFSSTGQLQWHFFYSPDSLLFSDDANDLLIDTDGFLLSGTGYYPGPGIPPGYGAARPYFIKTDTNGILSWKTIYGKGTYYWGESFQSKKSSNNNYYSACRHKDSLGNDYPGLVKILINGDTSYNHDLVPQSIAGLATIINIKDDTTIIFGMSWSSNSSPGPVGLMKTDTLGNELQNITFLNSDFIVVSTVETTDHKYFSVSADCSPGCYIYACKVNSNLNYDSLITTPLTYDSLCPYPVISDTINPDCDLIVNIQEPIESPNFSQLRVFPNPAKDKITLVFPKYLIAKGSQKNPGSMTVYHEWDNTQLVLINLSGELIYKSDISKEQSQLEIEISKFPKGLYLFQLRYRTLVISDVKVIFR